MASGSGIVMRCKECGLPTDAVELATGNGRCSYCVVEKPASQKARPLPLATAAETQIDERWSRVVLSTSSGVPGREMVETVQIVAAEVALGMNILKDIANSWRDTFGGRSASVQNTLKDAREACLLELKREAFLAGADAVIAVRLDYSEISTGGGSGGGILFVAASGTAVKLKSA